MGIVVMDSFALLRMIEKLRLSIDAAGPAQAVTYFSSYFP